MLKQIKDFLNQPYPDSDDPVDMLKMAVIGASVVFFLLYGFKPFGLDQVADKVLQYCLGFAIISFTVAILFDFFFKYILKIRRDHPSWKLWKWMLAVSILVLLIAASNLLYIYQLFPFEDLLLNGMHMLKATLKVAVFPILIFGAINMNRNQQKNNKLAADLDSNKVEKLPEPRAKKVIQLPIKNSNKTFEVDLYQILLIESQQNYVKVYFMDKGKLQSESVRNTLSNIEKALPNDLIQRSHRSFLVNTKMIEAVSGNAQGLKLAIQDVSDFEVPVSRKFIPIFKAILSNQGA